MSSDSRAQRDVSWNAGWRAACLALSLLIGGCTALDVRPAPRSDSPATAAPAGMEASRILCLSGREVLRRTAAECQQLQAEERRTANPVSRVLNLATIDYAPAELTLDLVEGILVGARYRYRVEPSYRGEYFTRLDTYRFSSRVRPGELLGQTPIKVGFARGSQVLFAQQFASGPEARDPANGYLPDRIPFSSALARSLKPGDYVRFDARMGLTANAGQVWPLAGYLLTASTAYSVVLNGEYQVHLFRLDGDRVRLRLVGERARDASLSASAGASRFLKAALLNRVSGELQPLVELLGLDAKAALAAERSSSDLFMADYTMDLADPEVAAAYDQIFAGERQLASVRIARPLRSGFDLRDQLIGTVEGVDALARGDLEAEVPRVTRHFKGANYSHSQKLQFRMRLSSFDVDRSRVFRRNLITQAELVPGGGESLTHYLLPNWAQLRDRSMLFGMLDESQARSADALFLADAQGRPVQFLNTGFGFTYRDRRLRPSEYRRLRRRLELLLPSGAEAQIAEQMGDTQWLEDRFRRNFSLDLNYFFRESAFDGLVAAGFGEEARLRNALADFVVRGIQDGEYPYYRGSIDALVGRELEVRKRRRMSAEQQARQAAYQSWQKEIDQTAAGLATAFTAGNDNSRRMEAILSLRNSGFYRQVGTAFWAHLVRVAGLDLEQVMFLEFTLNADGHEGVHYEFGAPGERALYESVKFIQNLLNDRSLDLREPGDLESIISKTTLVVN